MKSLSHEVKVGAVAVLIIVLFFWLFNFLKGQNILRNSDDYYIYFPHIAGLEVSSPVEINGLRSGVVQNIKLINDGSGILEVTISIEKGYRIPDNSIAEITTASLIAGMKLVIIPGDSKSYLVHEDTLSGRVAVSILDKLELGFDPLADKTTMLIDHLDTLLRNINSVFTDEFGSNIESSANNLKEVSKDLRIILGDNKDEFSDLISDLNTFGNTLEKNNSKLDSTISQVHSITLALSESEIDSAITALQLSLENSKVLLDKLNNGEGSAGKFLNDDSLYLNLSNSLNSLNLLLIDIEKNPGSYVNFSLFGKKNK